jgi:tetratricopeptide (TPR) repeat protein
LIASIEAKLPLMDVFEASARCHLFNSDENSLEATFEHWTQFNPSDPAIAYYKGRWEEISDRFDSAISHFMDSETQGPLFLKPRFRRGILLRDLRRFDEASQAFESMIGSDLGAIAAVEAAHCLHLMGDSKAAWTKIQGNHEASIWLQTQQYQRADHFVEGNRFALVSGGILESLERYGEAIALLRQALEANHRDSEARVLLISCLNRSGKTEDAAIESKLHAEMTSGKLECKNLADQLEIESTDFSKRIQYATLLFRYKSLGESQLEAEKLQKEFPAEAETHRLLASIYRERAQESNDWNLRANAQERMARKLEAQNQAPKQSGP